MDTQQKQCVILMVEDDPGDQKLMKYALAAQKRPSMLKIVNAAEDALAYLQRSINGDVNSPRPDIVLLDLNMPGMGGKNFLRRIKEDERLCDIPVIIVSTSDSPTDIEDGYRLQAAGYVQKKQSPLELKEIVHQLTNYWFVICKRVKQVSETCRV